MSLATFSIDVAIWGKKFPLFYGKFPHFPHPRRDACSLNFFRSCYFLRCGC